MTDTNTTEPTNEPFDPFAQAAYDDSDAERDAKELKWTDGAVVLIRFSNAEAVEVDTFKSAKAQGKDLAIKVHVHVVDPNNEAVFMTGPLLYDTIRLPLNNPASPGHKYEEGTMRQFAHLAWALFPDEMPAQPTYKGDVMYHDGDALVTSAEKEARRATFYKSAGKVAQKIAQTRGACLNGQAVFATLKHNVKNDKYTNLKMYRGALKDGEYCTPKEDLLKG